MRKRLGEMVIGRSKAGVPITADDLGACMHAFIHIFKSRFIHSGGCIPPCPVPILQWRRFGGDEANGWTAAAATPHHLTHN